MFKRHHNLLLQQVLSSIPLVLLLILVLTISSTTIQVGALVMKPQTRIPAAIVVPPMKNVRMELFFRNNDDLQKRMTFFFSKGIRSFNLVNKSNKDDLMDWTQIIANHDSNTAAIDIASSDDINNSSTTNSSKKVSICAHYSIKYNKSRKRDGAFLLLQDFLKDMDSTCSTGTSSSNAIHDDTEADTKEPYQQHHQERGQGTIQILEKEVLLITGSGPKGKLDSLLALQRLQLQQQQQQQQLQVPPTAQSQEQPQSKTILAVAYNPFFPDPAEYLQEQTRLTQKIATGLVSKIYIQFGTDLDRLRSALVHLQSLQHQREEKELLPKLEICGSIFLPTKKLIAQQKFRPWNGVFLSEEFLDSSSTHNARGIVVQMMRLYQDFGCEILVEAPGVRDEKDWALVEDLWRESCSFDVSSGKSDSHGDGDGTSRESSNAVEKEQDKEDENEKGQQGKRRKMEMIPSILPLPSNLTLTPQRLLQPAIVLFGSHDVRLHDNIALQRASHHAHVIPVFVWDRASQGKWGVIGALEVVLKNALQNLERKLEERGLKLICRSSCVGINIVDENDSDSVVVLEKLCEECNAGAVYWNKEHTTESRLREERYTSMLERNGIEVVECQSSLLYDPMDLSLGEGFHGGHWGTLMPFLKGCQKQLGAPRRPIPRHETFAMMNRIKGPAVWPEGVSVDELGLAVISGSEKWDLPIVQRFPMSEEDAISNLNQFFQRGFAMYEKDRNRADMEWSTSKLSAHLRIGTLSPNELYYKVENSDLEYADRKTFTRRLFWRDLAYFHLLNFPEMRDRSIRSHYEQTEWVDGDEEKRRLEAW